MLTSNKSKISHESLASLSITIGKIVKKFKKTGVFTDSQRPVHHRFARSLENITIVSKSIAEDPNVSISCRSQEFGPSFLFKSTPTSI